MNNGQLGLRIDGVPELPFGQPADEGPELVIPRRWQRGFLATAFYLVGEKVFLEGRIELRLQESKQQVEQVDCVSV